MTVETVSAVLPSEIAVSVEPVSAKAEDDSEDSEGAEEEEDREGDTELLGSREEAMLDSDDAMLLDPNPDPVLLSAGLTVVSVTSEVLRLLSLDGKDSVVLPVSISSRSVEPNSVVLRPKSSADKLDSYNLHEQFSMRIHYSDCLK